MTATRLPAPPISSRDHPLVKVARALHTAQGRRRHSACLCEGRRIVESASATVAPSAVLHTAAFAQTDAGARALLRRLRASGVPVREVTDDVMATVTDTVQPQGIVAVVPVSGSQTPSGGAWKSPLILVLDAIADPGNAGSLVRTAAGVGASIIATATTTDLWSPKVVRAGAGAHFATTLASHVQWESFRSAVPVGTTVIVTDVRATTTLWDADLTGAVAIVVSNEAHGVSDAARRVADRAVRIPQGTIDSLNAAVAGGIVMYEAVRQRARAGVAVPETLEGAWT